MAREFAGFMHEVRVTRPKVVPPGKKPFSPMDLQLRVQGLLERRPLASSA